jgi:hypothetical protein
MTVCPYCGRNVEPPGVQGGRPRRWCSSGCRVAGEAKRRRVGQVLRRLEKDRAWHRVHWNHAATIERLDAQIAEQQAEFDRLAGVPERTA